MSPDRHGEGWGVSPATILTSYSRRSSSPLVFLRHFLVEGLSLSLVPPAERGEDKQTRHAATGERRNSVEPSSHVLGTVLATARQNDQLGETKVHRAVSEQFHLLEPDRGPALHSEAALKDARHHDAAMTSVSKPTATNKADRPHLCLFFCVVHEAASVFTFIMQSAHATLPINARLHWELQCS